MKHLFILVFLIFSGLLFGQWPISQPVDDEYCPEEALWFTVNIGSRTMTEVVAFGGAYIFTSASQVDSFVTWEADFHDNNVNQGFTVKTTAGNQIFTYQKIKSFNTPANCFNISPNVSSIDVPRCVTSNHAISFNKVTYETQGTCFGTIDDYEYQLPSGWSMGGITSTGSNWINGSNSATVSANISSPANSTIKIRAKNTCQYALSTAPYSTIVISRPRLSLSVSGDASICSGSKSYTIPSLPGYASASWSLSTDGSASIPSNPYSGSSVNVTKTGDGYSTLTANVTDCLETYSLPSKSITTGLPDIDRFIVYGQEFDYTSGGATYYYLVCPDEDLTHIAAKLS